MNRISFDCYKVGNTLPLAALASFLGIKGVTRQRDYLALSGEALAKVLPPSNAEKGAYLFHYGCVTLVNFNDDQKHSFLDFVLSGFCPGGSASYHESYTVEPGGEESCFLTDQEEFRFTVPTLANALAKITVLTVMEERLDRIFGESEEFIIGMRRGKVNFHSGKYARETAKIMRFQYDSAYTVRIFERCDIAEGHIAARELYDRFMERFDYTRRIEVLHQKLGALESIYRVFISLSQSWHENLELYIEIVLLALFPFFYL